MTLWNDQSQESRHKLGSLSKGSCTVSVDDVTGGNQNKTQFRSIVARYAKKN